MWVVESQIHQQYYLCSLYSTMPLQYVLLVLKGLKKKDQVLITYVYCMGKLSIKHLFICCGYSS